MAIDISPTVALARAASMASASRLVARVPSESRAAAVSRSSAAWHAASSRSARSRSSLAIWPARTAELSTLRTSNGSSSATTYRLTPITGWWPASIRAWVRAAASSIRIFGMPASMALAMPPAASTSSMCSQARWARSWVSRSTYADPAHGSMVRQVPDSCWMSSWVLRAIRALKSVGRAMASSSAFVCRLWVWPWVAAIASTQVRTTLLNTSWAVSDQPEVWQWVRSESDLGFVGSNWLTSRAHSSRAARSLATSMKKFIPMAQKKLTPRGERVDVEPDRPTGPEVLDPVGQGVRQLEVLGRPGLLHVVAGDRDRVEPRHLLRRVGEDVRDDPHRRLGRVDVGVADHELLEDVVLDGPRQLLGRDALLLGGDDIEREHGDDRAVHRHRHRHLVKRDAAEQGAHVVDRVDGDACHAHVALDPRVVAVVAAVGGEVEGDGQTLLASRRGCAGRRRWTPRRWRNRRTGGSSRAG